MTAIKGTTAWSDPIQLCSYREAPRAAGIYVICQGDNGKPPQGDMTDTDWRVGPNWPINAEALYVGMSVSSASGIRARIYAHFKGRGNKGVRALINDNVPLWYFYQAINQATDENAWMRLLISESLLMNTLHFPLNVRGETRRSAIAVHRQIDAQLAAKGKKPHFYDPREG